MLFKMNEMHALLLVLMVQLTKPVVQAFADPMINIFAVNTWHFTKATDVAFKVLMDTGSAVDAVVAGCTQCEVDQCDGTVGWGGSPDEDGHSTLDAMIMEGGKHEMGGVIQLKAVREAIQVARAVMDHTFHSILVGENATNFALKMGFTKQDLSSNRSIKIWEDWKKAHCQPNFWKDMINSTKKCGPYQPATTKIDSGRRSWSDEKNHDTIGMIALDSKGKLAAGTSTNGATHKIPGRSSDSVIPGSGAYVDNHVGGAVATGDGDIMMRFSPTFLAVELMRGGVKPHLAAKQAIDRITNKYPDFNGAVLAATKDGQYGAACNGFDKFVYAVRDLYGTGTRLVNMTCSHPHEN